MIGRSRKNEETDVLSIESAQFTRTIPACEVRVLRVSLDKEDIRGEAGVA